VLAARLGRDWFLAPDNGLLSVLVRRSGPDAQLWRIEWRPPAMSATFHGRDLFTPLAQHISTGLLPGAVRVAPDELHGADLPPTLARVCYVDHYGNLVSGLSAAGISPDAVLRLGNTLVQRARTFSDVSAGQAFWYENAFGLLEVAVNQGRADQQLGLKPGDPITFAA
jgi:S-adenosyl-L-methionine hydrolase (adenosine-forming)